MNGSQVAYHLRVNKHIDRQMFVEALRLVNRYIPITGHAYVSMAGAYLEDCRLLHQTTRISRMYSFDDTDAVIARQKVNRPFGFVETHQRSSKQVVEEFEDVRAALGGEDTNVVVWLDYVSPKKRRAQLQELGTLVSKLIPGDVVRITLNAHRTTLGENAQYERLPEEQKPPTLAAWRHAKLKEQLGEEYLPADRDDPDHLETKEGLYRTVIRAVKHTVIGALQPRPELLPFPVLSTAYDDNHGMVTVTCVIIRASAQAEFEQATTWEDEWADKPGPHWDSFVEIQVPYLSIQERHLLHGTIRHGGDFGNEVGFLNAEELAQYKIHYYRYPTFAPLDLL